MSQPCGFLSDFLSCPYRQTYQTLIAPPYTCPVCNGGFADQETIEMIQGPWGCNQMLRNHFGGKYAILDQWGNAQSTPNEWGGPAITSGATTGIAIPIRHVKQGFTYDYRITEPYRPTVCDPVIIANGPIVHGRGFGSSNNRYHTNSRRQRDKHTSHYKYKYTEKPATNCTVM
jgi:hypothetical protein